MPELHADLFSRHASPLEGYFFVVVDETGSRCYVRRDLSSKQRKTGKEEAWRPKCAAPRLGYERNRKATFYFIFIYFFSHQLIDKIQSVVTVQDVITLEWKITSGGKQIKTEDNTHNN